MNFRTRLMISFALLISLTFGVGGTLLISTSFYSILSEEQTAAGNEYETIQNNLNMLINYSSYGDYNNMYELLSQMEEQNIAHWQAISLKSKGMTIYESGDEKLLNSFLSIPDSEQYAYVQQIDENGRRLQMYSELPSGGETLYLRASFDLSSAYELRENQQKLFLLTYVIVVLLGIVIAGVISSLLTKRLETLTKTAREVSEGNLSVRTGLRTGDEFEQLSRDFDAMTDKLEENILKLEEDVRRQEAFMGAVAHELKTPMTSIIGYADLIRQCALDEEESMMAGNYIYTEGQRLEKLSHKILDLLLMEKDTFSMKKMELEDFLRQAANMLLPQAEEKGVEIILENEDFSIYVEPDLGKSLMYNLIDNAIKATASGGKIWVRGSRVSGGCKISVTDEGYGMKESEIDRITEAFYRVDKSRSRMQGGAGLGLTLCKKIVDLHQGTMTFQSEEGKGCCVTVELYGKEADHEKI